MNAIVHTHMVQMFRTANNITILAPTNDAVATMDATWRDRLFPRQDGARQADPVLAPAAIGAHVVQGQNTAAQLASGMQLTTVAGTPLSTAASGETVTLTGAGNAQARITAPAIACTNGVIYPIDRVLLP